MKNYYYGFKYLFIIDLVSGIYYDKIVLVILKNFFEEIYQNIVLDLD